MLTVVSADDTEHDVILHADADTPLSEIASMFMDRLGTPDLIGGNVSMLYEGSEALAPSLNLGASPLRYGARIGLNRPLNEPADGRLSVNLKPSASGTLLLRREPRDVDDQGRSPLVWLRRSSLWLAAITGIAATTAAAIAVFVSSRLLNSFATLVAIAVAGLVSAAAVLVVLRDDRSATRDTRKPKRGRSAAQPLAPDDLWTIAAAATNRLWEPGGSLTSLRLNIGTNGASPLNMPLPATGMVAITGFRSSAVSVACWLVAQIATLQGPDAVQITVITNDRTSWEWVRWLPHCRSPRGGATICLIGNDLMAAQARMGELNDVIAGYQRGIPPGPEHVVVFDEWDGFIPQRDFAQVFLAGSKAGIYSISLGEEPTPLPAEDSISVALTSDGLRVLTADLSEIAAGKPHPVTPQWYERLARTLAPIVDPDAEPGLPESSRLTDVIDLDARDADAIVQRWSAAGNDVSAVIGETARGPFTIDLVRDGPHMLVAGTTGSGKTEFLRTLIASLAASYPPDQMAFLLIDYQGSHTYGDCATLPHTTGLITDLDPFLAERTLTSLNAELRRREYLLKEGERLPRLLIVVDEIAALQSALPEFVDGLARIAVRGRPLGIHLVVSTQRPSLITGHPIGDEASLRVAFRLSVPEETMAMLGVAEGPTVRARPGRCVIRSVRHPDEPPVPVQVSRIGALVRPSSLRALPWFSVVGWADLGYPEPGTVPAPSGDDPDTDLTRLVRMIRGAAEQAAVEPTRPPVLPPLPSALPLSRFLPWPEDSIEAGLGLVPFGLADQPAEQAQRPAVIDFAGFSNMLAVGPLRSGRSQLLRTLAGSIAMTHSTARVHIYAIEGGNEVLEPLADLPHCGAVLSVAQGERTAKLLRRLDDELSRRQELLAHRGSRGDRQRLRTVLREQHLPDIVVLLDGWETFAHTAGKATKGTVTRILREGPECGLFFVITAKAVDVAPAIPEILMFGRAPDTPAGRARWASSGTEVQVALLDAPPTIAEQGAPLRMIATLARRRDADVPLSERPFRVDDEELVSLRFHPGDANGRPIGREDVLTWLRARHGSGTSVALLGPRRAGKTWVLGELERRLIADGRQQVHNVVIHLPSSAVETPDALAKVLDPASRHHNEPAQWLLNAAHDRADSTDRLSYLLDEVGRLVAYGPVAVSWLRDLGQAGAWLVYTGTESDWRRARRWALQAPGSSFGNDVDATMLGPISESDAIAFLRGTAANLRVNLDVGAATLIARLVDCWPFYLQVVGDAVVRGVQIEGLVPDAAAIGKLIEVRLLDGWASLFEGRWEEIGRSGRAALLKAPGQRPGKLTAGQRNGLRDAGLLLPGDEWLADRPFFDWVARNATALRDRESNERLRA